MKRNSVLPFWAKSECSNKDRLSLIEIGYEEKALSQNEPIVLSRDKKLVPHLHLMQMYTNMQIHKYKKHKDSSTQIQNDKKPIVLP